MYQGVKRGEMRSRELSVEETPAEYSFAEGEHTFTLCADGRQTLNIYSYAF